MPAAHGGGNIVRASAITDAVDANVDRLVSLTQSLVNCRSDSQSLRNPEFESEANRCQGIVAGWLGDLGFEVERWQQAPRYPVVAARLPGAGEGRSLAFNGHVDVVPGGSRASWSHDPWAGEVADGRGFALQAERYVGLNGRVGIDLEEVDMDGIAGPT